MTKAARIKRVFARRITAFRYRFLSLLKATTRAGCEASVYYERVLVRAAVSRYRKAIIDTVGTSWFEHLRHEVTIVTRVARIEQEIEFAKHNGLLAGICSDPRHTTHTLRDKYHFLTAASRSIAH